MLHVGFDKSMLFLRTWVDGRVDGPRPFRMVIVIAPLCKVVGKFEAWEVSTSIFEINDYKLFVFVLRK
jgi:hypothetical protein